MSAMSSADSVVSRRPCENMVANTGKRAARTARWARMPPPPPAPAVTTMSLRMPSLSMRERPADCASIRHPVLIWEDSHEDVGGAPCSIY